MLRFCRSKLHRPRPMDRLGLCPMDTRVPEQNNQGIHCSLDSPQDQDGLLSSGLRNQALRWDFGNEFEFVSVLRQYSLSRERLVRQCPIAR